MSQSAEVIQFNKNEIAAFSEFRSQLATLKHDNSKAVFNYTDPKGNKEARSHIYKLRQTKSAVDKVRKEQKQESLDYGRRVDRQAREISEEIEGMIEVHEVPLREIEEKEVARVAEIKFRIEMMEAFELFDAPILRANLIHCIDQVRDVVIDDSFEEFKAEAAIVKDAALTKLNALLEAQTKAEAEQAELVKLREQAAAQERKDHEAKIAQQAREEAERASQQRAEQEKREREAEETRLKLQAEKAERERLEADNRARQAEENAQRQIKEAAEAAERSRIQAEQNRKDAEDRAERDRLAAIATEAAEQQRREADKKHKAAINNAAVDALIAGGIDAKTSKEVITLIAKGGVTNVTIRY